MWTVLSRRGGGVGGRRRVKNGLMWGCTEAGVHMAPEAPSRPGWQKGPRLSSRPLLKPLWESVVRSLSPPRSLSLSPGPAKECAFCKPTHTHGECLSPSVVSYYCNGWCKECCAIKNARMQRKHNRQTRRRLQARLGCSALFTVLDNGEQHSHKPSDPPPPMVSDFAQLISSSKSKRFPPTLKEVFHWGGVSARGPRFITNFSRKTFQAKSWETMWGRCWARRGCKSGLAN